MLLLNYKKIIISAALALAVLINPGCQEEVSEKQTETNNQNKESTKEVINQKEESSIDDTIEQEENNQKESIKNQ